MSRIQTSIIAFILLSLSTYVAMLLMANMNAAIPLNAVKVWKNTSSLPEEKNWQYNLEHIHAAIKLDPANPDYLENEAQLYRYRAYMFKPNSEQAVAANRQALESYQYLLTLRPSWAPYWSSIIAIKYSLWEYDDMMMRAIQNAARLAPWFRGNQHTIIKAGVHGWAYLDAETKKTVKATIERAMLLQPEPTARFAKEQGISEWLEPYIEKE